MTAALQPDDFAQPPPDPVPLDRVADLLRDGKADAHRALIAPVARLQHEPAAETLPPAAARKSARRFKRSIAGIGDPTAAGSGAQPLAAAGATRRDHLATALGGHAGAETVTALAHQFARLISPLHGQVLRWSQAVARGFGPGISAKICRRGEAGRSGARWRGL